MAKDVKFEANGPGSQQSFRDIVNNYNYLDTRLPSYLAKVIFFLEKVLDNKIEANTSKNALYDINIKIKFNNVIKYRQAIESYGNYGATIDKILEVLDNEKPNSRKRFFWNINEIYKFIVGDIKKKYPRNSPLMDMITIEADDIMDAVFDKLKSNYLESKVNNEIMLEDLDICLIIIVCKAFIDCKILENPNR